MYELAEVMDRLRRECPWDMRQTHASLAPYLLEETYEALDALDRGDLADLREELGDVLLQVVFHARVATERTDGTEFDLDDVAAGIAAKLIRRHPHVFAGVSVSGPEEVRRNWDAIKAAERAAAAGERAAAAAASEASAASGASGASAGSGASGASAGSGASRASAGSGASGAGTGTEAAARSAPSALDGVPMGQPALSLAAQLQRRAEAAGAPPSLADLPVGAEPDERADGTVSQLGADLFALVARARAAGLNPELELRHAAHVYSDRVRARESSG